MVFSLPPDDLIEAAKPLRLKAFMPKSIQHLKEACDAWLEVPIFYLNKSGKDLSTHKKKLVRSIVRPNHKIFRSNVDDYLKDSKEIQKLRHYQAIQDQLNKANWKIWYSGNALSDLKIQKIRDLWNLDSQRNYYSSASVQAAAQHVLPLFETYHEFARLEIKYWRSKIAADNYTRLKTYLHLLGEEIKEEKKRICNAMLARLKVASEMSNICYDDICHHTLSQLSNSKINTNLALEQPTTNLTSESFYYFHSYILNNGSHLQIKKLSHLSWLRSSDDFEVSTYKGSFLLVPKEIDKDIFSSSWKPLDWLFSDTKFCKDFLQERFHSIANIRLLCSAKIQSHTLAELLSLTSWNGITKLEQTLCEDIKLSKDNSLLWVNRVFRRKRKEFFDMWHSQLKIFLPQILEKKLDLALKLAQQLNTRFEFGIDIESLDLNKVTTVIGQMTRSIDESFKSAGTTKFQLDKWHSIRAIFALCLESISPSKKNRSVSNTSSVLSSLSQPRTLSYRIQTQSEPDATQLFESLLKKGLIDTSLENFQFVLQKVKMAIHKNVGNDLNSFWQVVFNAYLQTKMADNKEGEDQLKLVLNLIKDHAPKYLQDRAKSLEDMRLSSPLTYQIKCRALLHCFNDSSNSSDNKNSLAPTNRLAYK